jgi:hypothetical protein
VIGIDALKRPALRLDAPPADADLILDGGVPLEF